MLSETEAEMLGRIDERVKNIRDDVREIKEGKGIPMLLEHNIFINRAKSSIKWFKRTTFGAVVTTLMGIIAYKIWG